VRGDSVQIIMGSGEMPLMQYGAINTGRYQAGAMPQSTHLFSWPMNNYWVTNFNADQRGGHTWTYYLTSSGDPSNGFASRFGWGARVPFLTRILPGDGKGDGKSEGTFISGWPENVILVTSRPEPEGHCLIIHLREAEGKETYISLKNGLTGEQLGIDEVDVTGSPVAEPSLKMAPLESKFFKLYLH
jgi:alpha-mannosidase